MKQDYSFSGLSNIDPTMYEEESFKFLLYYQFYQNWFVYDSNDFGIESLKNLIYSFSNFHGKINFPEKFQQDIPYWSPVPIGVFKFLLKENGLYTTMTPFQVGYLVQGAYWSSGFYYSVTDNNDLLQLKLFVDSATKYTYDYPDTKMPS